MTFRKTSLRASLLLAIISVLLLPGRSSAQSDTRISGTVRDGSGSSVPGAQVSIKNDRTGDTRQVTTNQQGYFVVGGLRPSTYTI